VRERIDSHHRFYYQDDVSSEEETTLDDADEFEVMGEGGEKEREREREAVSPQATSADKEGTAARMKKYMGVGIASNFTMDSLLQSQDGSPKRQQKVFSSLSLFPLSLSSLSLLIFPPFRVIHQHH